MSNLAVQMVTNIQRKLIGAVVGQPDPVRSGSGSCRIGIDRVALDSHHMRLAAHLGAGAMLAVSELHKDGSSRRYA